MTNSVPRAGRTPYRVLVGFHRGPASPEYTEEPEVHELGYLGSEGYPLPLAIEPAEFEPLVGFAFPSEEAVHGWARLAFGVYWIVDVYGIEEPA